MTSVISGVRTAFGAVVNGLGFSLAGWLFHELDKKGYEEEIKRHNKALEDLSKAKEAFYENEVKQRDKIQQLRQEIQYADNDIKLTNDALDALRKVKTIHYNGLTFHKEPQLDDFYKRSKNMKKYESITMVGLGFISGYLLYKIT